MLDTIQYCVGAFSVLCFGVGQWGWKKHRDNVFPFENPTMSKVYELSFPIGMILSILSGFATVAIQMAK